MDALIHGLTSVLLEEWGGPRSPLALEYIKEKIIPDLAACLILNHDLWRNPTFAEILAWKLKSQYAYPAAVAAGLSNEILAAARRTVVPPALPELDPKEPWRRIFRLWVCEESLPLVEEKTGYPLAYLDLLFLRFKRLRTFLAGHSVSLWECWAQPELRDFGFDLLSFLYEFQRALTGEPWFAERLVLRQVLLDAGLSLEVGDLVLLLEVIHTREGEITAGDVARIFAGIWPGVAPAPCSEKSGPEERFPSSSGRVEKLVSGPVTGLVGGSADRFVDGSAKRGVDGPVERLVRLGFIQINKSGRLTLSQKSAVTLAPFLVPKLVRRLRLAEAAGEPGRAQEILLKLNPEVLLRVIDEVAEGWPADESFALLRHLFKRVNRRVDLHLLRVLAACPQAFALLEECLGDRDSLIRAEACVGLGRLEEKSAVFRLIRMLGDPAADVKAGAAEALGRMGSGAAVQALRKLARDYRESSRVRAAAQEAVSRIESRHLLRLRTPDN
ncbi:PBS lyase HEAT-like repeat [Acididesulfobacillus acetoxydans]|uniref:HEAT repeat protein n=1 Tax=Acididesulfobacillus acetoxydans TaxID=1561005 RepID=A0A8S0VX56_9FIRM|nr:HEAT repeat domain-containing protein [Acididesulfobacillus acetoxydans]CAA7601603.1 PBS lyase HEAT-like repeat [Acididesulfobacillus acetoxydans]CEJ07090.1 HEAT repeat protein [Acididesulfobacillus acetoxydans]